jgi:hypothetical protein
MLQRCGGPLTGRKAATQNASIRSSWQRFNIRRESTGGISLLREESVSQNLIKRINISSTTEARNSICKLHHGTARCPNRRASLRGTLHVPECHRARSGPYFATDSAATAWALIVGFCPGAERAGYTVLRFDFRGCGASDGEPQLICLEEVEDLRNAITFLEAQDCVDNNKIGVIGGSLGGSVALYVAAIDQRVRACAANGAIGNGERRFRFQYPDDAALQHFRSPRRPGPPPADRER